MFELYQDSMLIVKKYDKPDLFITFTCSPKWEEISSALMPNQKSPIFLIWSLECLEWSWVNYWMTFAQITYYVYSIEFQKVVQSEWEIPLCPCITYTNFPDEFVWDKSNIFNYLVSAINDSGVEQRAFFIDGPGDTRWYWQNIFVQHSTVWSAITTSYRISYCIFWHLSF